mmetsp:Transcript_41736/g.69717  ORF Transcript_41736/g.69717 Transcript_41736/m.69717 type:complete len:200 (-) Transcript_41736:286-885(-)
MLLRNLLLRVLVIFLARPILVADLLILVFFLLFRLLVVLPLVPIDVILVQILEILNELEHGTGVAGGVVDGAHEQVQRAQVLELRQRLEVFESGDLVAAEVQQLQGVEALQTLQPARNVVVAQLQAQQRIQLRKPVQRLQPDVAQGELHKIHEIVQTLHVRRFAALVERQRLHLFGFAARLLTRFIDSLLHGRHVSKEF